MKGEAIKIYPDYYALGTCPVILDAEDDILLNKGAIGPHNMMSTVIQGYMFFNYLVMLLLLMYG